MWTQVADVAAQAQFGTRGINDWFKSNIINLFVLVAGGMMLWKGKSGDNAGVLKIAPGVVLGLGVVGLAITNTWEPAARFLAGLVGG